ncbi:N-acetyl-gamma-glutamyl-phosphate reductase [Demequina gelatinilytica]|uniref:N-acetyl-gamma-glutamyl-phosphate reductase n=1 Tax=Demequina gelatinilytica TaxID=1638980 RepID=UPI000781940B|nr:N-acetyl-gamma-glutamyl-phosphate reductase [Demequina gelatinilytica]
MVIHMSIRVAVSGASGYVGGEVLRVFSAHPEVEFGALTAHSSAGDALGLHQPHLRPLADRVIVETSADTLAGHDVVVLALPHGASGEIAAQLPPETLVIDCGADHRLSDPQAWADYYGGTHAGTWPYGMPELITAGGHQRDALPGARRIAVPGCNVTAVTLALQPGVAAGVVDPTDIVAVLANGYSGAGKKLAPHLLASEALGAAAPYAVGGSHRHIPEIVQNLTSAGAAEVRLSFTPTLVPMARGILATVTAPLASGVNVEAVRAAWENAYADEPFVHVLPEGQWPTTAATLGANTCLMQVAVDGKAGRVVVVAAIDNLVKGTAGAALQSMNVALGLEEALGLSTIGTAP